MDIAKHSCNVQKLTLICKDITFLVIKTYIVSFDDIFIQHLFLTS